MELRQITADNSHSQEPFCCKGLSTPVREVRAEEAHIIRNERPHPGAGSKFLDC